MSQDSVRERFRRWFESLGISQAAFSERLECDQAALSRLLAGKRGASLAMAAAIERESNGLFKAVEWIEAGDDAA